MLSPSILSTFGAINLEENQVQVEFNAEYNDEEEEDEDDLNVFEPPPEEYGPQFTGLNSSLPDQLPEQHHLTSYVSTKRSGAGNKEREKKYKTKWHFGIRSHSPPTEVMPEIYRVLKILGMEWKEKKN
jgi:carbon catabolite-derepressing protein kinase